MKQNKRDTSETALKSATKAVENGKWWPCKRQLLVECEYCKWLVSGYWRIAGHAIVSLLAKRFMVDLACSPHVLSGYSSFHTGWMDGGWRELFRTDSNQIKHKEVFGVAPSLQPISPGNSQQLTQQPVWEYTFPPSNCRLPWGHRPYSYWSTQRALFMSF